MVLRSQVLTKDTNIEIEIARMDNTGIDIALIVIDIVIAKYSQQVLISILLLKGDIGIDIADSKQ